LPHGIELQVVAVFDNVKYANRNDKIAHVIMTNIDIDTKGPNLEANKKKIDEIIKTRQNIFDV